MNQIKVAGICGSLREHSYTRLALELALKGAAAAGVETQLINLRDYDLGFCDGNENEHDYPGDVARLKRDVRSAQGLILGTPEYHGGYSGVLKNALDLMSFEELGGKMMGLIGISGGALGATNALNSLRVIGRVLHSWVVPAQVSIANAHQAFDESHQLKDKDLEARIEKLGRDVARFAYLHLSGSAQEFLKAWEESDV